MSLPVPTTSYRRSTLLGACLAFLVLASGADEARSSDAVQRLRVEVVGEMPHDRDAFTQGLLFHDGALYESTGRYGESTLRRVDPESAEVLLQHDLESRYFGEGLALVDDRLVQLTWNEGTAFVYDLESFAPLTSLRYGGPGWGLCFDGDDLWMSNGSDELTRRDPESFAVLGRTRVTLEGRPLKDLNELECAEGWLYANIWQTDWIARIDKDSGRVVALIDAASLRQRVSFDESIEAVDAVLNGIAYREDNATFLLTGKLWPKVFEVIFVDQ